jgi:LuxR family transcriptional regulator, maltose regulon positive regulatory protein
MNHAVLLLFTNQLEASEARLDDVARALPPEADDERIRMTRGQLILMRANLARAYGDVATCTRLSREALAILPAWAAIPHAGSVLNLARAYLVTGDVSADAERLAEEAVRLQQRANNQAALMNAFTNLAWLRVLQGRLRAAADTYEDGRTTVPGGLQGVGAPAYHLGMGSIAYETGDLETAAHHFEQSLSLLARGTISTDALIAAQIHLAVARLGVAQGDHARALQALNALRAVAPPQYRAPVLVEWATSLEARIRLAQGDLDGASRLAEAVPQGHDNSALLHEFAQRTLARVWIAQSRRDRSPDPAAKARVLLERLRVGAVAANRWHSVIEISVLQALAAHVLDDREAALYALAAILSHAADEGYVRVFLDAGEPLRTLLGTLVQTLRARPDVPQAQL